MSNPVFIEIDITPKDTETKTQCLINLAKVDRMHPGQHGALEGTIIHDLEGAAQFSHTPYETIRDRVALATQQGPRYIIDGKAV